MALQKRWDRLRTGPELILDQRGADMADLLGGASGMLVRDCRGKGGDTLVYRFDTALLNRLRAMVSLPKYSRQCRGPRAAIGDGWRDLLASDPRRGRRRRG